MWWQAFIAWRNTQRGKYAAAAIFILNLLVLAAIGYLYTAGHAVAMDSLRAMVLRTVVWLVLFLGLAWLAAGACTAKMRWRSTDASLIYGQILTVCGRHP